LSFYLIVSTSFQCLSYQSEGAVKESSLKVQSFMQSHLIGFVHSFFGHGNYNPFSIIQDLRSNLQVWRS
jgi:hypothetical protein